MRRFASVTRHRATAGMSGTECFLDDVERPLTEGLSLETLARERIQAGKTGPHERTGEMIRSKNAIQGATGLNEERLRFRKLRF